MRAACVAWFGVVWCGMVWYGLVWFGVAWYEDVAWHGYFGNGRYGRVDAYTWDITRSEERLGRWSGRLVCVYVRGHYSLVKVSWREGVRISTEHNYRIPVHTYYRGELPTTPKVRYRCGGERVKTAGSE